MASTAQIYVRLAGSRLKSQFQYRLSFAFQVLGAFLLSFLDFVAILVIFHQLPHLAGWSLPEVSFLYGSSYIAFKTADVLMTNMDRLPNYIRMGSFDQVLTRPLGTLGQVMTGDIDVRHLGGAAQGVIVLVYALGRVDIAWTPQRIAVFVLMLVSGLVIFCSLFAATNAIAFWTMDAREVANSFTYGGNFLTQFPMNLYGVWLRRLLGYGALLGFISYFPALYILDKADPTHAPAVFRFLSPVAALLAATVAGLVWRTAVRHYRSTGS